MANRAALVCISLLTIVAVTMYTVAIQRRYYESAEKFDEAINNRPLAYFKATPGHLVKSFGSVVPPTVKTPIKDPPLVTLDECIKLKDLKSTGN